MGMVQSLYEKLSEADVGEDYSHRSIQRSCFWHSVSMGVRVFPISSVEAYLACARFIFSPSFGESLDDSFCRYSSDILVSSLLPHCVDIPQAEA